MTREQLNAKLDRTDISGIGVECIAANGSTVYYFYEDFDGPARPTASRRRWCKSSRPASGRALMGRPQDPKPENGGLYHALPSATKRGLRNAKHPR